MKSHITRQHETTTIPELFGECCLAFKAASMKHEKRYGPLFLQLASSWHRFYLDAGLLFWEEGPQPDPDDDLLEGEYFVDFGAELNVVGSLIAEIEMTDCRLLMKFDNGASLMLKNKVEDVGAEVVQFVPGRERLKT